MPKRTDIHSILIIGSGPIVIGQGCEFDYSGVQACRGPQGRGLPHRPDNSNPATIMTDPEFADATYIEPITPRPSRRSSSGNQKASIRLTPFFPRSAARPASTPAIACYDRGIFTRYGVQMIGANRQAIFRGEDRQVFKDLMIRIGLKVPRSGVVHNMDDARKVLADIGLPSSSAPHSPSAAPAAASPTTSRNSKPSSSAASTPRRSPKSSSSSP